MSNGNMLAVMQAECLSLQRFGRSAIKLAATSGCGRASTPIQSSYFRTRLESATGGRETHSLQTFATAFAGRFKSQRTIIECTRVTLDSILVTTVTVTEWRQRYSASQNYRTAR